MAHSISNDFIDSIYHTAMFQSGATGGKISGAGGGGFVFLLPGVTKIKVAKPSGPPGGNMQMFKFTRDGLVAGPPNEF